ncbi:MAG: DUF1287 domain-containing protein [Pseudoxanthomonas sp.]
MKYARVSGMLLFALLAACRPSSPEQPKAKSATAASTAAAVAPSPPLVDAARRQIGVTLLYDPAYVEMPYPGGDVPAGRGVCTDVVVRALRMQGLDLQRAIHEDMRAHFAEYPRNWGLKEPNPSIDHRRVPNQMRWFEREGWSQPITASADNYAGGDIVAWKLAGSGLLHIGILSDRKSRAGIPLAIHNIGNGTQEDDLLFKHTIIGHYRPVLPMPTVLPSQLK